MNGKCQIAAVTRKWTRRECFEHFGAEYANQRWSWSGRSRDGTIVVMTMWQDEIIRRDRRTIYESRLRPNEKTRPGATERLANLKWARDHCDGLVRVVIAVAKDVNADPRSAIDWFPQDRLIMKITELDETGSFRAESVDGSNATRS